MKINYKTILKVLLGVVLLGLALSKLDFDKTWDSLRQCDYRLLLLALMVSVGNVFWVLWLRKKLLGLLEQVSCGVMFKAYLVSNYMATFTPANIGGVLGEPWGLYSFSRGRITMGMGLAFSTLTTIAQNVRRVLLTLLGVIFFSSLLPRAYIGVILLTVLVYVVYSSVIIVLLFPKLKLFFVFKPLMSILNRFAKTFSEKLQNFAGAVGDHFRLLLGKKKSYFILAVMVTSNVALESLRLWLLLLAFGVNFDFFVLLLVPTLAYSVTVLPVSLGGLGVTEVSGMIVFQSFGIAPEIAFSVVFLDRFFFVYWGFVLGGVLIPFMKTPFSLQKGS